MEESRRNPDPNLRQLTQVTTTLQDFWIQLGRLRCPIGLVLFTAGKYETVSDVAARSGAELVDFREPARATIPADGRYVDFRPDTLLAALRTAHDSSPSRKVVVRNFDLGVSRLRVADRNRLWETLVDRFPPNSNTTVVLAMPDEKTAMHLLPPSETLKQWFESNRAFRILPV